MSVYKEKQILILNFKIRKYSVYKQLTRHLWIHYTDCWIVK